MNPFQIFSTWFEEELKQEGFKTPSACCLSTIGLDEYPNARFVALKEMRDDVFIFCGSLDSRKGIEIKHNSKVALTFWWDGTEKQVRIQGSAMRISTTDADTYFSQRERKAQIVSSISKQGHPIADLEVLMSEYTRVSLSGQKIERPENWGGFSVSPIRIEFLEFNSSRFHKRVLFQKENNQWDIKLLQP